MKNTLFFLTILALGLVACEPAEPKIEEIFTKKINLLEHGVPVEIQAPEDAKVINNSTSFFQELRIEGQDYLVLVYGIGAGNPNCSAAASDKLAELKVDQYIKFGEVLEQQDCGFVYSLEAIGDTSKAYNFHHFRVQGNQLYHFTSSAGGRRPAFTKEQMRLMYKAVLPKETK